MFSKTTTDASTKTYSQLVEELRAAIDAADAVLVGAGAGLSTAAGLTYSGERFDRYFADFRDRFGITDIYSGGFYPYPDLETYWAWWSRHVYYNRYDLVPGKPYLDLLALVQHKDHFVLTTNVDHQFQLAGFDKQCLFYTQGDYGLFQCVVPCHRKTYDNEREIRAMVEQQEDLRIPSELIPTCPNCGKPMVVNLRHDASFVQDDGWYEASGRYEDFLMEHKRAKVLLLELGVGSNSPGVIKYPFWDMAARNKNATYACVNYGEAYAPRQIAERSICINADLARVLADVRALGEQETQHASTQDEQAAQTQEGEAPEA